ncbi:MAG: GHKL domain-containing protein, partial [Clostridia bacterium]|nr:GHKL domain-containing protein [Clostridia bacterium]
DFSVIIVSNSCNANPMSDGKALPFTTKANKQLHGYGLKSVRNTLKKYNGDISFDYDEKEKVFVVTVMVGKQLGDILYFNYSDSTGFII